MKNCIPITYLVDDISFIKEQDIIKVLKQNTLNKAGYMRKNYINQLNYH